MYLPCVKYKFFLKIDTDEEIFNTVVQPKSFKNLRNDFYRRIMQENDIISPLLNNQWQMVYFFLAFFVLKL